MTNTTTLPLGKMILSHLRKTPHGAWSLDSLRAIQALLAASSQLQNIPEKNNPAEKALRAWIGQLPTSDAAYIQASMPAATLLFLGAMLPVVIAWAREQDWRDTVDMHDATTLELKLLTVPQSTQYTRGEQLSAAATAAQVTADIILEVANRNDAWALLGPWTMSGGMSFWPRDPNSWLRDLQHHDTYFEMWTSLALASQRFDAGRPNTDRSRPVLHRWEDALMMSWQHLDCEQECRLTKQFLACDLVDNLKTDLCGLALHASTLSDPEIKKFMLTQLPVGENARLDALVWSKKSRIFNEDLAHVYIPRTAGLVDLLDNPSLWGDVHASKALLKDLTDDTRPVPILGLPPGAFDDTSKPK